MAIIFSKMTMHSYIKLESRLFPPHFRSADQSNTFNIQVMTRHVQRVNSIYRAVGRSPHRSRTWNRCDPGLCLDFDMDGQPDNVSFMIKRIKVHTGDALADPSYRFPGNYGVEKFLEIFSGEHGALHCTVRLQGWIYPLHCQGFYLAIIEFERPFKLLF